MAANPQRATVEPGRFERDRPAFARASAIFALDPEVDDAVRIGRPSCRRYGDRPTVDQRLDGELRGRRVGVEPDLHLFAAARIERGRATNEFRHAAPPGAVLH